MSEQPPPAPTASAVDPCATEIQIVGRPSTRSLTSTIAPHHHPLPIQVDEQLGLREDHGKPAEAGWCEAGALAWGGQTQAPHRQPSICSGQYLRRLSGSYPDPQEQPGTQSPGVCGYEHAGSLPAPEAPKKHQEGEGCKKECREEAHQARAVQRGPLQKANLLPWHGCPAVRASSHLRATSEQGLSLTLWLQALDRKNWGGHAAIWTQGCGSRGMSRGGLRSCSTPEDPIRW